MDIVINFVYLVEIILAVYFISQSIGEYRDSAVGSLFVYFLNGTVALGLIRLFFLYSDFGLIKIDEVTLMIFWHIMFFIAVGLFLNATSRLSKVVGFASNNDSFTKSLIVFSSTLVLYGVLFVLPVFTDSFAVKFYEGTTLDKIGALHFVAFVFAGYVTFYLLQIHKKFEGNIKSIAYPLLFSVGFLSIIHLWELINESWKIIKVSGEVGEGVERILWIPVYGFIAYGFWKFRKISKV